MVSARNPALIVRRFPKQHYTSYFNPNSGFFARIEDAGTDEPFWSQSGPELLDVSITNWCDHGCFFCYRKSTSSGRHMNLSDYREVMRQARDLGVFQVALGGGNPNQHPQFEEILRTTREDFGIVPNFTSNGRGLSDSVLESTRQHCGAVAVSAYEPYRETAAAVEALVTSGITTNIHFLLTSRSIETAISWLHKSPAFLQKVNSVVFLNYKPVGPSANEGLLANHSPRLEEFFSLATDTSLPWRVGFDTCTVTGLARLGTANPLSIEGCDAGRFSLFVSEEMKVYPCSFMVEAGYEGIPLSGSSLLEIWLEHPTFQSIREKHMMKGCPACRTPQHCLSGCPLFPEMNLCAEACVVQSSPLARLSRSADAR